MSNKISFSNFFIRIFAISITLSVTLNVASNINLNAQNSPYSSLGLGNISPQGFMAQEFMGGVGVSNTGSFIMNNINPALIARNKNTILDIALYGQQFSIKNSITKQQELTGSISHIAVLFPVYKKYWTTQLGFKPYSNVEYLYTRTARIPGNQDFTATYTYEGSGGLNSFFWGNGFTITKNVYVGAKINYLFGNITNEVGTQVNVGGADPKTILSNRVVFSNILLNLGAAATFPLKNKSNINVGASFDLGQNIGVKRSIFSERRDPTNATLSQDTLLLNSKVNINLPYKLRLGVSYEKPSTYTFGVDVFTQAWKNYSDGTTPNPDLKFQNSTGVAVGAEITPNFKSGNFFKRSTYRLGTQYQKTAYLLNGQSINEFGISFGTSLPVGISQVGLTYINLGLTLGQRGTTNVGLIQENYFKITLGATINDLLWFNRPKIE